MPRRSALDAPRLQRRKQCHGAVTTSGVFRRDVAPALRAPRRTTAADLDDAPYHRYCLGWVLGSASSHAAGEPDRMSESTHGQTASTRRLLDDPPGGILMWIVVTLELLTFGIGFVMLAVFRTSEAAIFAAGQRLLATRFGLLMTLTLLTSGWLVSEAVHAVRLEHIARARGLYAGGILVGVGFVGLKIYDFSNKIGAGLGLGDDFGAAYFLASGFHLLHVVIGLAMLLSVATRVGRTPFEDEETAIAGTALFWHMCDIAWLFLFPIFYVR